MTLDEFLNQQKTEALQRFDVFWTGTHRSSSSKFTLLSRLRRAMLDPEIIRERYGIIPGPERRLLELILHTSEGAKPVAELTSAENASARQEGRLDELLRDLASKGFLDLREVYDKRRNEPHVAIAEEFSAALRKTLQSEFRHPEQIISLLGFAESLSLIELRERIRLCPEPDGLPRDESDPVSWLMNPAAIRSRLQVIHNEELERILEKAILEFGGLLPLETVKNEFPNIDEKAQRSWKERLEELFLGTFGSLSLDHLGFNVSGDYLVVFMEVTSLCLQDSAVELDPKQHRSRSHGANVLLDFSEVLNRIQKEDLRTTRTGSLRKYGADETIASLLMARDMSREEASEYLQELVSNAFELRLVQQLEDGTLTPSGHAVQWSGVDIDRKFKDVLTPLLSSGLDEETATHSHHLRSRLPEWCAKLRPGRWYAGGSVARLAIAEYLLEVIRGSMDSGQFTYTAVHSAPVNLKHLEDDLLQWLEGGPHQTGVFDFAWKDGSPIYIRASAIAGRLFDFEYEKEKPLPLIVNPDFEVVVFPGTAPEIHLTVHRSASLSKIDQVYHYQIDERSITIAACLGLTTEEIVRTLSDHCQGDLPQNISYSIENWAGRIYNVSVSQVFILELKTPEMLQHVKRLPEIAPLVLRELSPTILALREAPTDRSAIKSLQELGIYIRRDG